MISINDQRVLAYNSGGDSWSDYTKELSTREGANPVVTLSPTQYLYFGSFFPFNNKYIDVFTANVTAASLDIEVFNGTAWVSVNEIFDYTDSSGTPFAQSGVIQFTTDKNDVWSFVGDTHDNSYLTEFSNGPSIYDKYWLRISSDISTTMTLNYIGQLFCSEQELRDAYPQLTASAILNSWESGKTDWLDQRISGSEYIVSDLKRRGIIIERSQVVENAVLNEPAIHRTAQLIYSGLGPRNYAEEIKTAADAYKDSMNMNKFEQDANANGQKDRQEINISTHRATR